MFSYLHFIRRFYSSQDGAVLPLFVLVFMVLVTATGVAIDYSRAQMVQSKLQASLDAAGLAAAAVSRSRNVEAQVLSFMDANFAQQYMAAEASGGGGYGSSFVTRVVQIPGANGAVTLDLSASARVNTTFLRAVGINHVPVDAAAQINLARARGMELVLVLDNSGSMAASSGGQTRLAALKQAVSDMVDQLYAGNESFPNMFIGLVPFNHQVRVTNAKPSSARWVRANSGSTQALNGAINRCFDDRAAQRNVNFSRTDTPPNPSVPNTLFNFDALASCSNAPVIGLRQQRSEIVTAVNAMNASGNTRIDVGAVWGWRMLSPRWRGLWAHANPSLPLNYNAVDMDKVVILLTDGENVPVGGTVSAAQANANLRQICNSMKAQGIIVYSIVLHLNHATTQNLMRDCATTPDDHYFFVAPNARLTTVFQRIAESLMNLRIAR